MTDTLDDHDPYAGLVIEFTMTSKFPGTCCIDDDHAIVKKEEIARVASESGETLGFCCVQCLRQIAAKPKKQPRLTDEQRDALAHLDSFVPRRSL